MNLDGSNTSQMPPRPTRPGMASTSGRTSPPTRTASPTTKPKIKYRYTNVEYTWMYYCYAACQGNSRQAAIMYAEKFPKRKQPNHKTIQRIHARLIKTGYVQPKTSRKKNQNESIDEQKKIKKEEPTERPEEEEKKKEEKPETSIEAQIPETTPATPDSTTPAPVETPANPSSPTPAPASPSPSPPAEPAPVPATPPSPVSEPVVETVTAPVVETAQETIVEKTQEVPVVVESLVEKTEEVKVEELPPPLPASPPPTEAPPPTPVATTPAQASQIPDVSLHAEVDSQDNEVVGGGGESMAEHVEVDAETEDKLEEAPLVNGISDHTHKFVEEITEKVEMVSENFKTIVSDSIISTQVTVTENSDEKLEQTAPAAE